MGKSDQSNVQGAINTEQQRQMKENQGGIDYTKQRQTGLYDPRSDVEHSSIWGAYSGIANDPAHGISDADRSRLLGVTGNYYGAPSTDRQPTYTQGGGQPVGAGYYQGNIPGNPLGATGDKVSAPDPQDIGSGRYGVTSSSGQRISASGQPSGGTYAGGGGPAGGEFGEGGPSNPNAVPGGGGTSTTTSTSGIPGGGYIPGTTGYSPGYPPGKYPMAGMPAPAGMSPEAYSALPGYLQTSDQYLRPDDSAYRSTYTDLMGKSGGFDPDRTNRINTATGKLYDTSGNYGDVNRSISSLQDASSRYGDTGTAVSGLLGIGRTGGVSDQDYKNINRDTLTEFEKTGGYSDQQLGDIRARSNSALAANYSALKDQLARRQASTGQLGPGWGASGFKLARQGAQDNATNARNTEVDLANAVRQGRADASSKLADVNLGLQGIKTDASLKGYGTAGTLDVDRQTSINNAMKAAGDLGLQRQSQIDDAMAKAAGIDVNTQDAINRTRLGGASGLRDTDLGQMDAKSRDALGRMGLASSDTIGRMNIAASNSNASAARSQAAELARMGLDAENQRFLISQGSQNQSGALSGLTSLYGTGQNTANQNASLLYNYRMGTGSGQNSLINSMISNNASNKTDWSRYLGMGLQGASLIPGLGGGGNGTPSTYSGNNYSGGGYDPGYGDPGYNPSYPEPGDPTTGLPGGGGGLPGYQPYPDPGPGYGGGDPRYPAPNPVP